MNFSESLACYKELMSKAERYIWNNAEVGYKEYKTDAYMKKAFKDLGYEIKEAGDITGFSAEIDTGREGPTLALLAELDALYCSSHPETNKETGAVLACGHNIQCASLLGVAAVLREKNALDNLCGKIRLIVVPAEEGMVCGTVTNLTFKGVHYEIIVDIGNFKWMIQTTDYHEVGSRIGLKIDPDAIHVMKKSEYSGKFGDYSTFSDEIEEMSINDEEQ